MQSVAGFIVSTFISTVKHAQDDISRIGNAVPIPRFPESVLKDLCQQTVDRMSRSPGVVPIMHDVIVVGDIHGNLHNLLQVFSRLGFPPHRSYLFLGNFINFGEYSLETATLLLALMLMYPESVTVLRGIAESFSFSVFRGLALDVMGTYKSNAVVEAFTHAFCNLPFAALVKQRVFCSQPITLAKCGDLDGALAMPREAEAMKGSEGYTVYCDSSGVMSDEIARDFVARSFIDCVVTGDVATNECLVSFADGIGVSISCCETEGYCCVMPLVVGDETEPFVFDGIDPVVRDKAMFRDVVQPAANPIKKGGMILKAVSNPKLRLLVSPQIHHTRGKMPPVSSMRKMVLHT